MTYLPRTERQALMVALAAWRDICDRKSSDRVRQYRRHLALVGEPVHVAV